MTLYNILLPLIGIELLVFLSEGFILWPWYIFFIIYNYQRSVDFDLLGNLKVQEHAKIYSNSMREHVYVCTRYAIRSERISAQILVL